MGRPELAQYYTPTQDDGRGYKHPFRLTADGKPLTSPSVTTVLKLVDKSGMSQWAADQTLQWAIDHAQDLLGRSEDQAMRGGRYRWRDARDERAQVGTGVHEHVEAEHTGSWEFPELDEEQEKIMDQWRLFNERYDVTPLRSEFTIWNFSLDYAGTADGLWIVRDRETHESFLCVIDVKTSKSTWPEHWMQLAALKHADVIMEKGPGGWIEIDPRELYAWDQASVGIVHLRADSNKFITITHQEVEMRYAQFAHYRKLWSLGREIDTLRKDNERGAF